MDINGGIYSPRRHVLVVDDELINRQILGMTLSEDYEVAYAENGRAALDYIRSNGDTLSLVMLDILMPELDGFQVLAAMQSDDRLRRIPVIVLTSEKSAELRSLEMGAADFIAKPYDMPEIILARASRIINLAESRTVITAAANDDVTGLLTEAFFYEYAQQLEKYHTDWQLDAVALNIERFHLINDLYGHAFGNAVLKCIGRSILAFLGSSSGVACRLEGDMFFFYCHRRQDYEEFLASTVQTLDRLADNFHIRLRMGINPVQDYTVPIRHRFDRARVACNMLRGNYRQSIMIYSDEMRRREIYNQHLVNDIHKALEEKQFIVYFQPKYNIRGEKPLLTSAEALIRWQHPDYGMVSPGDFIPLFEGNGLIQLVDHYVWRGAARFIRRMKDLYGVSVPISINVSRVDLHDPELDRVLDDIIMENGLDYSDLYLEVTESAYAGDTRHIIDTVSRLRNKGFHIELDDFGSGYSSLNMLTELPIDVLKMDMKFIQNVKQGKKDMRLIELIMDIAGYLKVPVVAEGVETEEQMLLLKEVRCDIIQGYYFSRPLPPEEFEKRAREELCSC